MLGQPLFPGESGIDQLVEIIKVLGTPTKEQIRTMNPNYMEHKFPQIKPHPFNKASTHRCALRVRAELETQVFRKASAEAIDLIAALLEYTPTQRLSAIEAMCHPFFDELRDPACRFPDSRHPNGSMKDLPDLFEFSRHGRKRPAIANNIQLMTFRTIHTPGSKRPSCTAARPRRIACKRTRPRQACAHDEGRNESTS